MLPWILLIFTLLFGGLGVLALLSALVFKTTKTPEAKQKAIVSGVAWLALTLLSGSYALLRLIPPPPQWQGPLELPPKSPPPKSASPSSPSPTRS